MTYISETLSAPYFCNHPLRFPHIDTYDRNSCIDE